MEGRRVNRQVPGVTKGVSTRRAAERPSVRVHLHVRVKSAGVDELAIAPVAFENLLRRDGGFLLVRLTTIDGRSRSRSGAGLRRHVRLERRRVVEDRPTDAASHPTFVVDDVQEAVNGSVTVKTGVRPEDLPTDRALVRTHLHVVTARLAI